MTSPSFDFLSEHASALGTLSEELRTLGRSLSPDQATAAAWIDKVAERLDAQAKDLRAEMDGGDKSSLGLVAWLGKRRAGTAGAVLGWLANSVGEGLVGKVAESLLPVLNNLVPIVMANADDAFTFVVAAGFLSVAAQNALDAMPDSSMDIETTASLFFGVATLSSGTMDETDRRDVLTSSVDASPRPDTVRVVANVPAPTIPPDDPPNTIGSRPTPSISPSGSDSALLAEDGNYLLTENGDRITLE